MRSPSESDRTRVAIVTLGCSKNIVDSERLAGYVRGAAFALVPTPAEADVVVVNTCGFIDPAREESLHAIRAATALKERGAVSRVFVAGCLVERLAPRLRRALPAVDGFFGTEDFDAILRALRPEQPEGLAGARVLSTPAHYAYLKISEGCDHPCAFCAIPQMRGRHVSRPQEEIVAEAEALAAQGVRELIVVAQDTTAYGVDRDGARRLPALLDRLADVAGLRWIRLLYAYPAHFPLEVLDVMAARPTICKYLDLPVQHASDRVLRAMRRGVTRRALEELIGTARARVPGLTLRTTLIVGFPAETRADFAELESFVSAMRFDRLGVFTYSHERGTAAYALGDRVPAAEKKRRRAAIMERQQTIALELNAARVGGVEEVVIDACEAGRATGRTERDAPEIDNAAFVTGRRALRPGDRCRVRITAAEPYDVTGVAL